MGVDCRHTSLDKELTQSVGSTGAVAPGTADAVGVTSMQHKTAADRTRIAVKADAMRRTADGDPDAERSFAFPPVVDANTRVLVLGTLPGGESLRRAQYYGHPRNAFWRLVGAVIGAELEPLAYDARLATLQANGVGVADVYTSAVRRGSLDTAIRAAEATDLLALVKGLPALRAIGFNGNHAARVGRAGLAGRAGDIALLDLPSSSPAFARMPFADKRAGWAVLGRYLTAASPAPGREGR